MLRRILKWAAIAAVALVATGAVLFALGLRVVLYGGGTPRLVFVESESERSARIARDREAQRARTPSAPAPAPAAPETAAAPEPQPDAAGSAAARPATAPADWTDFRGPNRDGHYRERPLLASWPADGLKPIWKHPIGGGYASFVIAGGRAFTIEQRGPQEIAAAYDVATGRELWTSVWTATFRESMGGDGPRATPTWAGGRVYALGGTGELRCLEESTGALVWRTNILEDSGAANLQWGMSAAPLVVDDTVIVLPGGSNGRSVVAYDRRAG